MIYSPKHPRRGGWTRSRRDRYRATVLGARHATRRRSRTGFAQHAAKGRLAFSSQPRRCDLPRRSPGRLCLGKSVNTSAKTRERPLCAGAARPGAGAARDRLFQTAYELFGVDATGRPRPPPARTAALGPAMKRAGRRRAPSATFFWRRASSVGRIGRRRGDRVVKTASSPAGIENRGAGLPDRVDRRNVLPISMTTEGKHRRSTGSRSPHIDTRDR